MKKLLTVLSLAIAFLFIGINNVSAHQGHASCKNFGSGTANLAKQGVIGDAASSLAISGPNAVSDENATSHADDSHCTPH